ncbi:putative oxalocrotonate tautomerase enzyme domain-containing protein [Ditylenchus destructor]|uniref:Oxalocrotonate tautomerase enzyme domain-containing protein n=1 Tax=Ditylenchus destructor TaxID=166010 RepID=A0AAD4R768_9BILA|nr:putative oxalocrotonate tautomerase enzyme domain-containing protein [Ditylenchus destructor]
MPLHRFYVPEGLYTEEDKKKLAQSITDLYTNPGLPYVGAGLPPFYVVVLFIPVKKDSYYVGGKANDKFVRVSIQHIARHFESHEQAKKFVDKYEERLAPFIKDRGLDWEIAFELVDRNLWRENGLVPPLSESEGEKLWVRLNKPVPYE